MPLLLLLGLVVILAYLIGSIPFGYLVAKARGVDILKAGSGNIGATNVGRTLGRGWGLLVFGLDLAKGALPVAAAQSLAPLWADLRPELAGVTAGVATFLGHLLPVFLGFRGGKGVATGAGVVLVLVPVPAALALASWALVVIASRFVSLGSLIAGVILAAVVASRGPEAWSWPRGLITGFCCLAVALVFWRHRANIWRLWKGQENRLRDSQGLFLLGKILHVGAVGLWFGMAVFFTFVVGLSLFQTFDRLSAEPRPYWLPVPSELDNAPPGPHFPNPLCKEQGSRLFGAAVGPMFIWYYTLQWVCAAIAVVTALGWFVERRAVQEHRIRVLVLLLALLGVGVGWAVAQKVSALRAARNNETDAVLMEANPTPALIAQAEKTRQEFGLWHFASLMVNFATLLFIAAAMGMAAVLPEWRPIRLVDETQPVTQ